MKKSLFIKPFIFVAVFAPCAISAQDINREITIEREIVPELRAATRLNPLHNVLKPDFKVPKLVFSDRDLAVGIVPRFTAFSAASTLPAIEISPFRGYADFGYFPAANASLSAGYQIISNQATVLNGWLQGNMLNYNSDLLNASDKKIKIKDNAITAGLNLLHQFSSWQKLGVEFNFGGGSLQTPRLQSQGNFAPYKTSQFQWNLNSQWFSGSETQHYTVGLAAGMFNFGGGEKNTESPVHDFTGSIDFGLRYNSFAVDIETDFLNFNHFSISDDAASQSGKTLGVISAKPAYYFENENIKVRIGVNVQYTLNGLKKFHIAPDVHFSVSASPQFSFYANVGGGEQLNTLASVYESFRYVSPLFAYNVTNSPVSADFGFVIGSFSGFSVEAFGGYAVHNNGLMPLVDVVNNRTMSAVDFKGWHVGAKGMYKYGNLLSVSASFEMAPQKFDKGYYLWKDRAKQVLTFAANVHPIKKLSLDATFELRSKRCESRLLQLVGNGVTLTQDAIDLNSVQNLTFGASWRFTPAFTVFAQGSNLLNRKWLLTSNLNAQGITTLVGFGYKF